MGEALARSLGPVATCCDISAHRCTGRRPQRRQCRLYNSLRKTPKRVNVYPNGRFYSVVVDQLNTVA